ncbi:MAG: hypothetical protein JWM12_2861, partial [Ilumatobacteraceae bacterium]|nr:hypothetical protein [Ilumatobacteraceae bacterium]
TDEAPMTSSAEDLPPEPEGPTLERRSPIAEPARPVAPVPPPSPLVRLRHGAPRDVDLAKLHQLAQGSPVVVTKKLRWWLTLLIAAAFVVPLTFGGFAVYHALDRARRTTDAVAPPASARSVDLPIFTVSGARATSPALPTLPGGAASLFDDGAAAALAPLLDQAVAGDPTQFTSIILYADHAVTTARDATDPTRTVQITWLLTGVTTDAAKVETIDFTPSLFHIDDVDWNVIPALVAAAPGLTGLDGHPVTDVVVQRWGFDPTFPMRVLVYVDGGKFVEAAVNGQVLAVH